MLYEESQYDFYRMTGVSLKKISIRSLITIMASHQIRYMILWRKAHHKMTFLGVLNFCNMRENMV